MKKSILSIAVLASIVVLSSCKKDYACQCTTTCIEPAFSNGGSVNTAGNTTINNSSYFINDTEKKATSTCEGGSSSYTHTSSYSSYGQGNTICTIECTLK